MSLNFEAVTEDSKDELQQFWNKSLDIIRNNVNARSYQTWFAPIKPIGISEHTLTLEVPNKFFYEWLENHYIKLLKNAVTEIAGYPMSISYNIQVNQPFNAYPESLFVEKKAEPQPEKDFESNLNSNYTFENFIIGDGNKFAQAAAWAVAESPGSTNYNPLIIYGGTGLGKTHLIQAIGHHVRSKFPAMKVYYASSENFTSHFINSIQKNKSFEFSKFYRSIDVLLIDDIQFFSNKGKTQEEFFHTFNNLHQNKKQIVLTSDRPINEMSFLEERLVSRFKWGLVADIQPPDLETRIAILRKKCEDNRLDIPNEIIDYLAVNLESNVRELEGALTRLMAKVLLTHTEITLDLAQDVIGEIVKPIAQKLSIDQIVQLTARSFEVPEDSLRKKGRKKEVAFARQVAMYLSKELTLHSTTAIGLHFGGRDHSTVIYAHRAISKALLADDQLQRKVAQISKVLQNSR